MTRRARADRPTRRIRYPVVLAQGTRVAHTLLALRCVPPPPGARGRPQIGIIAGKAVGPAVARNRARRRVREALRTLLAPVAAPWTVVALLQPAAGQADCSALRQACEDLLRKAKVLSA